MPTRNKMAWKVERQSFPKDKEKDSPNFETGEIWFELSHHFHSGKCSVDNRRGHLQTIISRFESYSPTDSLQR